ncbi:MULTISPECIES: efflux RND transporter periplasmic adaptor subunit [unclassified Afipia]|uniref:efflux RND transporter periplasmic adaptor subunit n=1 Tax=unclassified Afipia TaxID=2642050 RepID=UPI00040C4668|nr:MULTISPECIES: efflux RND transporter periplasmic adaptor subunit [unclassified Afipia]MBQ8103297.1 efflux RND transporter periplasmic adaptor subunit [Afipia sp.]MBS4002019.1 efflux RND transporter periplasmic adaptor subunit [Afipia sp.]WIG51769.1 MAG: CzcABC family efflux RND transporter, membrane fusion protein [Afipia sp.]
MDAKSSPSHQTPAAKSPQKPIRMRRWLIIVGGALVLLVGIIWGFNAFRSHMIAEFFKNNKPPPTVVAVAEAKSEVLPNLLTAVGDLAAINQVNVTTDVNGRVTEILFQPGSEVKAGDPLLQIYDAPEQSDLASFKAQTLAAQLALDRAKTLLARSFGPQATVDQAQAAYDQGAAAVAKTEAIISQKRITAPFNGVLGVRLVQLGQYLSAGTQIVSLTDLSRLYLNFTVTEKDRAVLNVGQTVRIKVDAYPGRTFEGKITTIEPQISADTRNVRVQATLDNPNRILQPGMFASTTVELPPKPAVITVPETAVDYTLYGDSVWLITETKGPDGKVSLKTDRTFVKTGQRINGRVVIASGIKPGDRVVAVGQLKLQSGSAVTISPDQPPQIPAQPPRY